MKKETIFSALMACAVIFASIVLINKSIKPITQHSPSIENKSNLNHKSESAPEQETPKNTTKTNRINKCILDGKIVYSDIECAPKAKSTVVKIEDSEGIGSLDRETVEATMQRIITENKHNREQNTAPVMSLEVRKKISPFCDSYKNQIEQLDAQARRENSSYTTERIRQSRWNVQKLQLDGNCYK